MVAEGQHARADGLTSLAVVAGVVGVWLGFPRADAIVGLLIAAAILWILVNSLRITRRRLMDGVEPDVVERMEAVALGVDGVVSVGQLRVRWTGHRLEGDANIAVDSSLSVLQGHHIAEVVEHELLHQVPHLEPVVIHLNPVVDGVEPPELHALTGHHANAAARAAYQSGHIATG